MNNLYNEQDLTLSCAVYYDDRLVVTPEGPGGAVCVTFSSAGGGERSVLLNAKDVERLGEFLLKRRELDELVLHGDIHPEDTLSLTLSDPDNPIMRMTEVIGPVYNEEDDIDEDGGIKTIELSVDKEELLLFANEIIEVCRSDE